MCIRPAEGLYARVRAVFYGYSEKGAHLTLFGLVLLT